MATRKLRLLYDRIASWWVDKVLRFFNWLIELREDDW